MDEEPFGWRLRLLGVRTWLKVEREHIKLLMVDITDREHTDKPNYQLLQSQGGEGEVASVTTPGFILCPYTFQISAK